VVFILKCATHIIYQKIAVGLKMSAWIEIKNKEGIAIQTTMSHST